MGRIRILTDQVANQIAAGEVVDRPASVVKELVENALDAGASRIRIEVEGGGRRLIRVADNGHGMGRDDALLAFERHATSKVRAAEDLMSIRTLGFRGEALPSIGSVSRLEMETAPAEGLGTRVEIAGGRVVAVEDAGSPPGTTLTVRDLFFNLPARRKFLKAESTELQHVTALVTHYALAHPGRHFELVSSSHTVLNAPPVTRPGERIYQIFGRETHQQLIPFAAERPFDRAGLPEPPPWRRAEGYQPPDPGMLRVRGFLSRPELQKLNRNSIYVFANQRLVRDRLILHAVTEAYRNVLPPTSFPVVLLFLEMPPEEIDVNVHPAKTEVRFRQQALVHDFVRDTLRNMLIAARPAAGFLAALTASPNASPSLLPSVSPVPGAPAASGEDSPGNGGRPVLVPESDSPPAACGAEPFHLRPVEPLQVTSPLPFGGPEPLELGPDAGLNPCPDQGAGTEAAPRAPALNPQPCAQPDPGLHALGSLKPLAQLRESFILAVNQDGLWIVDQHVAHERVLFEKLLRERAAGQVERQRLLLPLLVELRADQMVVFAQIAAELDRNGFEVEPFGPRTLAVKATPSGLEAPRVEKMLIELLDQAGEIEQGDNLGAQQRRIAASVACHAAIKVNMPLDQSRMEWLLDALSKTEHPTSCPHGRPIALRYPWKDIERAFSRI